MLKRLIKSPTIKRIARVAKRVADSRTVVSLYNDVTYDRSRLFPRIMINGEQLLSDQALQKLLKEHDFKSILDIGSGKGHHSEFLQKHGKDVTKIDFGKSSNFSDPDSRAIIADYLTYDFGKQFDAIWCSHVLEHQVNTNLFLKKIFTDLKEGGILSLTVPPMKNEIVGGHVSVWNGGLLIYHLVLAGFDCSDVAFLKYDYNLSIILKKRSFTRPTLTFDTGDLTLLKPYLPLVMHENCYGDFDEINWFQKLS